MNSLFDPTSLTEEEILDYKEQIPLCVLKHGGGKRTAKATTETTTESKLLCCVTISQSSFRLDPIAYRPCADL